MVNLFVQISGLILTVVGRGYFSHASLYRQSDTLLTEGTFSRYKLACEKLPLPTTAQIRLEMWTNKLLKQFMWPNKLYLRAACFVRTNSQNLISDLELRNAGKVLHLMWQVVESTSRQTLKTETFTKDAGAPLKMYSCHSCALLDN